MTDILSHMPGGGRLRLGAIADDFTGGSDMAGMLARQGVRTMQTFGVPDADTIRELRQAEAVVVSLKSRSIPAQAAIDLSLRGLECLQLLDAAQIQFKYCSTFDSTEAGNIGPVTSALMQALNVSWTVAVPALPVNGRTQYMGNLFVNGVPLSESHMRHHPLNPMADSNLVRHLQRQTHRKIGLVDWHAVQAQRCTPGDEEIALVDALQDVDLERIAHQAAVNARFLTGGSGIAHALASVWDRRQVVSRGTTGRQSEKGRRTLILAGSCSAATLVQISSWIESGGDAEKMDVSRPPEEEVDRLCDRIAGSAEPVLVYSSARPAERVGHPEAIERAFAKIAYRMRDRVNALIVAGGETSGAVVEALNLRAVEIGPEIDPGVPVLFAVGGSRLQLALKSGNFGAQDFFRKACHALNVVAG